MNETNLITAKTINAKELAFAKFKLVYSDKDNSISAIKGQKFVKITYNKSLDLYDVELGKIRNFEISSEQVKGVYCDQLRGLIENHFPNFEYVMDSIRIVGVNC